MHLLGRAGDGVDRAGLDAQGAADAELFVDEGHRFRLGRAVAFVERLGFHAQQLGELLDAFLAARRTQVDVGLALGDGLGIGPAAGKAALPALRLRQDGVDLFRQRVALHLEADRRPAEHQPDGHGQADHHQNGG